MQYSDFDTDNTIPNRHSAIMATAKPAIVLVPGSFHFPKHFATFIARLQTRGYEAVAVQLASNFHDRSTPRTKSHHEDATAIKQTVKSFIDQGKDVVVMCHSYGGLPTTEALAGMKKTENSPGVVHIIYCCAFVPMPGQTAIESVKASGAILKEWTGLEDDGITRYVLDKETVIEVLYEDVDSIAAQKAYDDLGLMSLGPSFSPLVGCAWKEIPCTYIHCENDKALPASVQEMMCEQAGIGDIVRLSASHSPFLSQPDEVVSIIERVVQMYS